MDNKTTNAAAPIAILAMLHHEQCSRIAKELSAATQNIYTEGISDANVSAQHESRMKGRCVARGKSKKSPGVAKGRPREVDIEDFGKFSSAYNITKTVLNDGVENSDCNDCLLKGSCSVTFDVQKDLSGTTSSHQSAEPQNAQDMGLDSSSVSASMGKDP